MFIFSVLNKSYTSKRSHSQRPSKDSTASASTSQKTSTAGLKARLDKENVTVSALVEAIMLQRALAKQMHKNAVKQTAQQASSTKSPDQQQQPLKR